MSEFLGPLVTAIDGEPRASTTIIARGVRQQHASVIRMVRKYQTSFAEFGHVDFRSEVVTRMQGGGSLREYALLNEKQASLLLAFMRNSPKVVEFKVGLIREFYRMRDELGRREATLWQQMHALIAKEVESKVRASFGSRLMLERRREIPRISAERDRLNAELQPSLLPH
ncbi:Rha family transcriptional regulator [Pandoraea pnomenusa]|uniref:Rha family transcriptional regulator n=1 Tax=Pandoraea pnomenusa TaxID=93220 RepID=UPI003340CF22